MFPVAVGAGSAVCVVANRLSANGKYSVLLLEAGGEETGKMDMSMPLTSMPTCIDPDNVWFDDVSVPQESCKGFIDSVSG